MDWRQREVFGYDATERVQNLGAVVGDQSRP
jgi:hypothetical protein